MDARTLDIVTERRAEDIHEPDFAAYEPLVPFEAFLSAQRLFGWVRLDADRLTDLLNAHELLRLMNVHVEDLRDSSTVAADETLIPRAEIIAVVASGPRGAPTRRVKTSTHAVAIDAGTYRIDGYIHAPLGVDPVERWRGHGPMIPLTDARLEYRSGADHREAVKRTLIVNRDAVHRFDVATDGGPAGTP